MIAKDNKTCFDDCIRQVATVTQAQDFKSMYTTELARLILKRRK